MMKMDLFEGQMLKERGMSLAAESSATLLQKARDYAREHAVAWGHVTADDVSAWLDDEGLPDLGPAAGSLFRGKEWEFTGQFVQSSRVTNHARLLRVWRLR